MDREELGVALLLSLPVAVGVALGVLKQTLGSKPIVAFVAGLTAGSVVLAVVVGAIRSDDSEDGTLARLERAVGAGLPEPREAGQADLVLAAVTGAVVTVFVWYIPMSPLLGGTVAGFLAGGSEDDARFAGMLSGALVPLLAVVVAAVVFLAAGASVFGQFPFGPVVALLLASVAVVYSVGFARVGGWVGWKYLSGEGEWGVEV
jgi:hypothetical protein